MQASLKATVDCVRAFAYTDFRPDLAAFTVPLLVIHGTADKTVPIEVSAHAVKKALAHEVPDLERIARKRPHKSLDYPQGATHAHAFDGTGEVCAFLRCNRSGFCRTWCKREWAGRAP